MVMEMLLILKQIFHCVAVVIQRKNPFAMAHTKRQILLLIN